MTPLRQRLVQDLTRRNYSPRTDETYVLRVAQFAKHFGRSPDQFILQCVALAGDRRYTTTQVAEFLGQSET